MILTRKVVNHGVVGFLDWIVHAAHVAVRLDSSYFDLSVIFLVMNFLISLTSIEEDLVYFTWGANLNASCGLPGKS